MLRNTQAKLMNILFHLVYTQTHTTPGMDLLGGGAHPPSPGHGGGCYFS